MTLNKGHLLANRDMNIGGEREREGERESKYEERTNDSTLFKKGI